MGPSDHTAKLASYAEPQLDRLLELKVLAAGVAPSASIAVGVAGADGRWAFHLGAAGSAVGSSAVYDLASLSKPLTAIVALTEVGAGKLALDATVGDVLPQLAKSAAASATLAELLSHRAGLPAWAALYASNPFAHRAGDLVVAGDPPSLEEMLARAASRRDPSAAAVYSDLGYVLVAAMLAAIDDTLAGQLESRWSSICGVGLGERLRFAKDCSATLAARWIFAPASVRSQLDQSAQPTEVVAFRGGEVRGVVHDENAWMLGRRGFCSGHAGAFGTAIDVAAFGARVIDALDSRSERGLAIAPELLRRAVTPASGEGTHGLGFDTLSPVGSSAGNGFSARSFGHLGFTGCSLWCDPDARVVVALLTNRTFPTRKNVRIRAARPQIHDAVRAWLAR